MDKEVKEFKEVKGHQPTPGAPAPVRVARLWSPLATIPKLFLNQDGQPELRLHCSDPISATSDSVWICPPTHGRRTIATDELLADMLIGELKRRGVDPPATLALIGQWDTEYSRSLADKLSTAWDGERVVKARTKVLAYNYMRGIDGQIPGAKVSENSKGEAKVIERPLGDAQMDYLRRIRDALLAEDARLWRGCTLGQRLSQRCGVRAVGVLGNDYFDKLLVLQALKPVFPGAVFFTTDLHADMLLPQDNTVTRNVLVAAGYGLSLRKDLQEKVPPLRDSYQTSLLLAVRLALRGNDADTQTPPPARLFEIGRTRAVELATPVLAGSDPFRRLDTAAVPPLGADPHPTEDLQAHYILASPDMMTVLLALALGFIATARVFLVGPRQVAETGLRWLQRRREDLDARCHNPTLVSGLMVVGVLLVVGALVAGGFALLAPLESPSILATLIILTSASALVLGTRPAGWLKGMAGVIRDASSTVMLAAGSVAVALVLICTIAWDLRHGGEPFALLEGVSVWPSEILRLTAGFLALYLLVLGHRHKLSAMGRIESQFEGLGGDEPKVPSRPGYQDARTIWADYKDKAGWKSTVQRIRWEVVAYWGLAMGLMLAWGFPNRPTRSDPAYWTDFLVIQVVIIVFLTLLFYMVDATRQALGLAHELAKPVTWPEKTLKARHLFAWAHRHGTADADAGKDPVLMDVQLVGAATHYVGELVWYPILVLTGIAIAWHPLFDAWSMPVALVVVIALGLAYSIGCAWALRQAAEKVRDDARRILTEDLWQCRDACQMNEWTEFVRAMLAEIENNRDGAFRPFSQQPVVRALLTLIGSASGLALLEYSAMANL